MPVVCCNGAVIQCESIVCCDGWNLWTFGMQTATLVRCVKKRERVCQMTSKNVFLMYKTSARATAALAWNCCVMQCSTLVDNALSVNTTTAFVCAMCTHLCILPALCYVHSACSCDCMRCRCSRVGVGIWFAWSLVFKSWCWVQQTWFFQFCVLYWWQPETFVLELLYSFFLVDCHFWIFFKWRLVSWNSQCQKPTRCT